MQFKITFPALTKVDFILKLKAGGKDDSAGDREAD
jgi:hypothetical protein